MHQICSAGRQRLNHSSLSLSRFSELNKALDTNEYNWTTNSVRLILSSQYPLCENYIKRAPLLWGLKQVFGTNLISLKTKLVTQTKGVPAWPVINQLWFPERHFWANCISLCLGEVQMKFYERSLQALLSSAPRSFAARSRVVARLVSLAQIGELARRLRSTLLYLHVSQVQSRSSNCSCRDYFEQHGWLNTFKARCCTEYKAPWSNCVHGFIFS